MTRRILLARFIGRGCVAGGLQSFGLLFLLAGSTATGWPGTSKELDTPVPYVDMAVLASREPRADLSCHVTSGKPDLGFDLRFHSDFRAIVPTKVLANAGGWLQVVMRVTPTADSERHVYLLHRFAIRDLPPGANGETTLTSGFSLGLGRYRVDWMMRDARERVCSFHWDLEAKAGRGQRDLPLTLGPNMVAGWEEDAHPVKRDPAQPEHIKILLNLTPAKPQESTLKPRDVMALFSMLSSIAHEPGVDRIALVAFNLREQRIVYRQDAADRIDFAALAKAAQSPRAGTIDYRLLQDPRSETRFVTRLFNDQLGAQAESPDAIIIAGLKVSLDRDVPLESLKARGAARCPIFYLNYNPEPIDEPWGDTIRSALKAYKGALAYNIMLPRDLGIAMRDILSRIAKRPTSEAAGPAL
jgi:hypothetical protein